MARANRHHIRGQVWHITHRCHKKEFLLKFARDRRRWLSWLFEAKKRFGLKILSYVVTSNHVHLLVVDSGPNVIPQSLQLIAGRTAQEFNQRKKRKGAFWEDRYHATTIERNDHLLHCLVYIDLNMVRAGVVTHPSEWEMSGYNEIHNPPKRYGLIDVPYLRALCGFSNPKHFTDQYRQWVQEAIDQGQNQRESSWPRPSR
jgi:REP element-mobilizing transposase RayT